MIKTELSVLPHALVEIVPGVTIGNTSGETIKVTVELEKLPAAPSSWPHNHLTRDVKPAGKCPRCDDIHCESGSVSGDQSPIKLPDSDAGR